MARASHASIYDVAPTLRGLPVSEELPGRSLGRGRGAETLERLRSLGYVN